MSSTQKKIIIEQAKRRIETFYLEKKDEMNRKINEHIKKKIGIIYDKEKTMFLQFNETFRIDLISLVYGLLINNDFIRTLDDIDIDSNIMDKNITVNNEIYNYYEILNGIIDEFTFDFEKYSDIIDNHKFNITAKSQCICRQNDSSDNIYYYSKNEIINCIDNIEKRLYNSNKHNHQQNIVQIYFLIQYDFEGYFNSNKAIIKNIEKWYENYNSNLEKYIRDYLSTNNQIVLYSEIENKIKDIKRDITNVLCYNININKYIIDKYLQNIVFKEDIRVKFITRDLNELNITIYSRFETEFELTVYCHSIL
jgi:hypothetical protein